MKKFLLFAEKAFTVISLIHYSGGPLVVILSGGVSEGEDAGGSSDFALIQLIFLVIYCITFCLLALRWKKVIQVTTKDGLIWLLVGLAIFSIFWSNAPDITRTRSIALVGTTMFALYLASRYSLKEQLNLLGWTFGISIVMSFAFVIALPSYGKMAGVHLGALRGIYSHKNTLGKVMAPSAIVFLLLALGAPKKRWFAWCGLIGSIFLIIGSQSSSCLGNLSILIITLFFLHILRWRYEFMIPTLIVMAIISSIIYLLLTTNAEAIAALFGKNLTLTGRTDFWPLILDKIWQRPWLGYGFGAFWMGYDGPSAYIWYASTFKAPNGHNGYLDLCLELGLVGLSIYLIGLITTFSRGLAYIRQVKTYEGFWPVIYLTFIVLANFTESTLIIQNDFFFVIQATIFFSLRIQQQQEIINTLPQPMSKIIKRSHNFKKHLHKYLN